MSVLDLLFPRRCLDCGRLGRYFCLRCRQSIGFIGTNEAICPMCERPAIDGGTHPKCRTRYGVDGLTACFRYKGIMRNAVKTLKYRLVSDLVPELISLIPEATVHSLYSVTGGVVVPIPLHVSRMRIRGFNQAEVLGKAMAIRLHMPMRTDMLRRTKPTMSQAGLAKKQDRSVNMRGAFAAVVRTTDVTHILLVDDVFTTGATLRSAASALKRAGVQSVWGVVIAR